MSPCNPAEGETQPAACQEMVSVDCTMGEWDEWSACSTTCGTGTRETKRKPYQLASHGGKPCDEVTQKAISCELESCKEESVLHCEWANWNEWGACSGCKGQKFRSRHIKQMPTFTGTPCEEASAKEVTSCVGECPSDMFCAWTAWSRGIQECDVCGTNTRMQSRSLGLQEGRA